MNLPYYDCLFSNGKVKSILFQPIFAATTIYVNIIINTEFSAVYFVNDNSFYIIQNGYNIKFWNDIRKYCERVYGQRK